MKRYFLLALLSLSVAATFGQSFNLPVPDGWRKETIPIPIDFAPQISYTGEEHLRFSPSWGDTKSEELWSYCFLWWINDGPVISKESLEKDLLGYYSGLVNRNIERRKIPAALVVPTVPSFKEVSAERTDQKTFMGTVAMLDYMSQKPVTLQVSVHVMACTKQGKLAIFFAISPQPRTHPVWKQFNMVYEGFRCEK